MSRYPGWATFDPVEHVAAKVPAPRRSTAKSCGLPFDRLCALSGLPVPVAEFRFHPTRKWRLDWAWPDAKLALEIHGGTFIQGKHSRGAGQRNDFEKWSESCAMGWRILHVLPEQLETPRTLEWIRQSLAVTPATTR